MTNVLRVLTALIGDPITAKSLTITFVENAFGTVDTETFLGGRIFVLYEQVFHQIMTLSEQREKREFRKNVSFPAKICTQEFFQTCFCKKTPVSCFRRQHSCCRDGAFSSPPSKSLKRVALLRLFPLWKLKFRLRC